MAQEPIHMEKITRVCDGKLLGAAGEEIRHLATDSRSLPAVDHVLFIAIRGENHDGNDYIPALYKKGVRHFLTHRTPAIKDFPGASFCVVGDALHALQRLTGFRRQQFSGTVIGITGSNGKTIVKEWLYQVLSGERRVVRSPRSYNSQLGVPLSLWQLSPDYDFAIIEAGISMPGEMGRLESIISPEVGILTNIGPAHGKNFSSDLEKLEEKLRLFKGSKKLVIRADAEIGGRSLPELVADLGPELVTWSLSGDAAYRFNAGKPGREGMQVTLNRKGATAQFRLPFSDDASVENLLHVITLLSELGIPHQQISRDLQSIEPVEMRLQTLKGIHDSTLVNDTYNSDLAGLGVALDLLQQQQRHQKQIVIISDLQQSGLRDEELYREVAAMLKFRGISEGYCIGRAISGHLQFFAPGTRFFPDTQTFLEEFDPADIRDAAVLIKGARSFHFEQITDQLQLQVHKTVLEINVNDLVHNLNYFRSLVDPGTRIMVMVKALSYGAGAHEIAGFLQHEQVDYLAVAFADEGIRLRNSGVELPVMVMNAQSGDYRKMLRSRLEPEIFSIQNLEAYIQECRYAGLTGQPVHIKMDTGMHRLGFGAGEVDALCEKLTAPEITLKSIFTHLAAADDPDLDDFTGQQVSVFQTAADRIMECTGQQPMLHVLNSAGTERFPQYRMDMVRVGIGLYGQGLGKGLVPVSTFKTVISQIRGVKAGETVGYGRAGKVVKDAVIATIPVGYADGINRHLGNGRYSFYVNGSYAPTIGNICMDMTMLDITGIDATVGDQVELFGKNCQVNRMADQLGTIVYEVLTGIPERVKRIYIKE